MAATEPGDDVVTFVDDQGRIQDATGFPTSQSLPPVGARKGEARRKFTAEEERMVMEWCAAAEAQNIPNHRVFQLLETVVSIPRSSYLQVVSVSAHRKLTMYVLSQKPEHTRLSYKNKWDKKLQHLPRASLPNRSHFPALEPASVTSSLVTLSGYDDHDEESGDRHGLARQSEGSPLPVPPNATASIEAGPGSGSSDPHEQDLQSTAQDGPAQVQSRQAERGSGTAVKEQEIHPTEWRQPSQSPGRDETATRAATEVVHARDVTTDGPESGSNEEPKQQPPDLDPEIIRSSRLRIDVHHLFCEGLGLQKEQDLPTWLSRGWVVEACDEYVKAYLETKLHQDRALLAVTDGGAKLAAASGRTSHEWKVRRARRDLQEAKGEYLDDAADKSGWSEDQHDLRFMIRIVRDALLHDESWAALGRHDTLPLCCRALLLMRWMRYLYQVSAGSSKEAERERHKKKGWLIFLDDARARVCPRATNDSSREVAQTGHGGEPGAADEGYLVVSARRHLEAAERQSQVGGLPDSDAEPVPQRGVQGEEDLAMAPPDRPVLMKGQNEPITLGPRPSPAPTQTEQDYFAWSSALAHTTFLSRQTQMLARWGVTPEYKSTCILVPADWESVDPLELMEHLSVNPFPTQELDEMRLRVDIAGLTKAWGRAAAWFNGPWPPRGVDVDVFNAGKDSQYKQMDGSHLCHHGLCINPHHLVYEEHWTNVLRNSCRALAKGFRRYGFKIPEACLHHKPPCNMTVSTISTLTLHDRLTDRSKQLAALSTSEAIHIQFSVLRQARGYPPAPPPSRPTSHDPFFKTFEHQLPLQFPAPPIEVETRLLATESPSRGDLIPWQDVQWQCVFCPPFSHTFKKITGFWAHVKARHPDKPAEDRLAEIVTSAIRHKELTLRRGTGKEGGNQRTWQMVLQASAPGFEWRTFTTWDLQEDKHKRNQDFNLR